jgi:hypothetical protein
MNSIKAWITNTVWQLSSYPAWVNYRRASSKVEETQQKILFNNIRENQSTAYGRRFSFSHIHRVSDYQAKVPLTTFDDYCDEVEQIGKGALNILTTSPVRIFEPSSGSTAPSKLIPYTDDLRAEFQAGILPWIFNLFRNFPDLKRGPAYWSISPLTEGEKHTLAGIPIGFEEDSRYLGKIGEILEGSILAVPNQVKNIQDMDNFKYVTLMFLLRNSNLRIISIWNPTFLTLLLDPLENWWEQLVDDIREGSINPPKLMHRATIQKIKERIKPDPQRAEQLSYVSPKDYMDIWPHLGLISCWMDGPAAPFANELVNLFPGVTFQGKGLIATEAFFSFPIIKQPGAALAITSHFFEFLPLEKGSSQADLNNPLLAHELEIGNRYSVVVTTGGGFYRYHLQDVIEVIGYYHDVPLIRFIGKMGHISDWFGEKLNESFVSSVLVALFRLYNLKPLFAMLAPNNSNEHFRYTLYLELPPKQLTHLNQYKLAQSLDKKLRQNFHYDYCRKLEQITHPDLYFISCHAQKTYLASKQELGQKLGDIKNTTLESSIGWSNIFIRKTGKFV